MRDCTRSVIASLYLRRPVRRFVWRYWDGSTPMSADRTTVEAMRDAGYQMNIGRHAAGLRRGTSSPMRPDKKYPRQTGVVFTARLHRSVGRISDG
jgi:hypothetical protein